MSLSIRRGALSDAETLARFNEAMADETEDKPLDADTVRAGVRAVLEHPERGFYLIAQIADSPAKRRKSADSQEPEDKIAGALLITKEWSDWRCGFFWWIQSVYVRPEWRRQGVYRRLYEHVKALASEEPNVCGLRLYVERENHVARRTYSTLGMKETSYRMYEAMLPNR